MITINIDQLKIDREIGFNVGVGGLKALNMTMRFIKCKPAELTATHAANL